MLFKTHCFSNNHNFYTNPLNDKPFNKCSFPGKIRHAHCTQTLLIFSGSVKNPGIQSEGNSIHWPTHYRMPRGQLEYSLDNFESGIPQTHIAGSCAFLSFLLCFTHFCMQTALLCVLDFRSGQQSSTSSTTVRIFKPHLKLEREPLEALGHSNCQEL